jgi:hypothetical protein
MAKRKKSKRRKKPTTSLISIVESVGYASIMTEGLFNTDPYNFITGEDNITLGPSVTYTGAFNAALTGGYSASSGADKITLREMFNNPTVGFAVSQANLFNNWQSMMMKSIGWGIGMKFGRKLMKRPIASINRSIFKPLSLGVRL